MVLRHTINAELPAGGKVFFLGGAGHWDFSSCPQLPAAQAKFQVNLLERKGTGLLFVRSPLAEQKLLGTELLSILGDRSSFPCLIKWWFHIRRDKLRRLQACIYPLSDTQFLWVSLKRVAVVHTPIFRALVQRFACGQRRETGHKADGP